MHPKMEGSLTWALTQDIIPLDPPVDTFAGTMFDLDATLLLANGTEINLDDVVTWEIVTQRDGEGAFIEPGGKLYFTQNYGRVLVRASWGDFVSEPFSVWFRESDDRYRLTEPLATNPLHQESVPSSSEIKGKVLEGTRTLSNDYGFSENFNSAAAGTNFFSHLGAKGSDINYLGASDGSYFAKGLYFHNFSVFTVDDPMIVIRNELANMLAADGMFGEDGRLNEAGRLAVNELVHAIGDQLGINLPDGIENILAMQMETIMANSMIDLAKTLKSIALSPVQQPTEVQKTRIGNYLRNIRDGIKKTTTAAAKKGGKNPEKTDKLLRFIRLGDTDGNGIPDWIDDIIRKFFPDGVPEWLQEILDQVFFVDLADDEEHDGEDEEDGGEDGEEEEDQSSGM